jgi:hypothetical protein
MDRSSVLLDRKSLSRLRLQVAARKTLASYRYPDLRKAAVDFVIQ